MQVTYWFDAIELTHTRRSLLGRLLGLSVSQAVHLAKPVCHIQEGFRAFPAPGISIGFEDGGAGKFWVHVTELDFSDDGSQVRIRVVPSQVEVSSTDWEGRARTEALRYLKSVGFE
jgi:hypothetical protein